MKPIGALLATALLFAATSSAAPPGTAHLPAPAAGAIRARTAPASGLRAALPDTVLARIFMARGFDAASRLEAVPGRKDPRRVAEFVRQAHILE